MAAKGRFVMAVSVYAAPLKAQVVEGEVVLIAPRTSISLTPEAALITAERLQAAARAARGQADEEGPGEIGEP